MCQIAFCCNYAELDGFSFQNGEPGSLLMTTCSPRSLRLGTYINERMRITSEVCVVVAVIK
jgi:hypothetical protein